MGGGWVLEIESFLGPVKWHRDDKRVPFGAQKTPTCPSNGYARIRNIMHRAVYIIGAQVVLCTKDIGFRAHTEGGGGAGA